MQIHKILISQKQPSNMVQYAPIVEQFGVQIDFKPFFDIEPLSSREFREQRINIADYTAVVFSSRHAIDAYFTLCEELRIKVPDSLKYFCTTEAVAMYLQKHIVFRKRKIFYGDGTPSSIISLIGPKHKDERFLVTTSDSAGGNVIDGLFKKAGLNYTTAVLVKSVSLDLKDTDLHSYDIVAVHNSNDIKSLKENFPDFEQKDLKFISFGKSIVKAMDDAGLKAELQAPTPEAPSLSKAIELYLSKNG